MSFFSASKLSPYLDSTIWLATSKFHRRKLFRSRSAQTSFWSIRVAIHQTKSWHEFVIKVVWMILVSLLFGHSYTFNIMFLSLVMWNIYRLNAHSMRKDGDINFKSNWTWIESQTSCLLEGKTQNKRNGPLARLLRSWNSSKEYRERHHGRLKTKVHPRNLLTYLVSQTIAELLR